MIKRHSEKQKHKSQIYTETPLNHLVNYAAEYKYIRDS